MIRFEESVCRDLDLASRREWLETNGIGGFASSTITGLNTRRYHGLLVAATKPPVGRMVLLSKVEETLVIGGQRFDLSCNRYPGVIHPQGYASEAIPAGSLPGIRLRSGRRGLGEVGFHVSRREHGCN